MAERYYLYRCDAFLTYNGQDHKDLEQKHLLLLAKLTITEDAEEQLNLVQLSYTPLTAYGLDRIVS